MAESWREIAESAGMNLSNEHVSGSTETLTHQTLSSLSEASSPGLE